MKYARRWAQLQPTPESEGYAFDWPFILKECFKLAIIWITAWWIITALFSPDLIRAQELPTPPSFPNCESLTEPGDKASYASGQHQIAGESGLVEGSDNVYSLSDGNAVQCFCPPEGDGIQTNWWKTDVQVEGWIAIENGLNWNLDDSTYLALNSEYECNQEEQPSGSTRSGSKRKLKPPVVETPLPTFEPPVIVNPSRAPVPVLGATTLPRTGVSVFGVIVVALIAALVWWVFPPQKDREDI